jgi:hypothetical protein
MDNKMDAHTGDSPADAFCLEKNSASVHQKRQPSATLRATALLGVEISSSLSMHLQNRLRFRRERQLLPHRRLTTTCAKDLPRRPDFRGRCPARGASADESLSHILRFFQQSTQRVLP